MKSEYVYPDVNDKITIALIKENEPFLGYWEKSEKEIVDIIKEIIQKYAGNSLNLTLLDAGCGTGRMLPEIQKYFKHIEAADPDSTRIEEASKLVKKCGFDAKVAFRTSAIEKLDLEKESIDVILCSHVIQHVHTDSVSKIFLKFRDVLTKDGLLFVMTAHSRKNYDYYIKSTLIDSKNFEEKIVEAEFNSLINNVQNVLLIHFFSVKNIRRLLKNTGFALIDYRSFHILCKRSFLDRIIKRDQFVNRFSFLKARYGRDILFIAKKVAE